MKFKGLIAVIFLVIIFGFGCSAINLDALFDHEKLFDQQPKPSTGNKKALSPVIFVNGDGGAQMDIKFSKPEINKIVSICPRNADWYRVWVSYADLTDNIKCFVEDFKLEYNLTTRKSVNPAGVLTKVPGFGSPATIEYLAPMFFTLDPLCYFCNIGSTLVHMGYKDAVSLRGAPYDFRKSPNELQDYYKNLKNLVEETYAKNNNLKVTFIIHSLGAPIMHYFLIHQDQKWKDKYIQTVISLSGAWAGSFKSMKVYVMGDNLGSSQVSSALLRPLLISFSSSSFLVPSREFWSDDEILIESPQKNFTLSNIEEFFSALNFTNGYEMLKDTRDLLYKAPPPGVEVHCLYGVGVPTADKLIYKNFPADFPKKHKHSPKIHEGDGDGTVNRRSLEACLKWKGKQKQAIYHKSFPKVTHMGMVNEQSVLSYLMVQLRKIQHSNEILLKKRAHIEHRKKTSSNSIHFIYD